MSTNRKLILEVLSAVFVTVVFGPSAQAQTLVISRVQSFVAADEARDIFNEGQGYYDEYRFVDAENKFREVVNRFPKNAIADRADYYLIRTLAQTGKKTEALNRINLFTRRYPQSRWRDDVQELRIQLTDQVPPRAEALLGVAPAPSMPPTPLNPIRAPRIYLSPPPAPPAAPPLPAASVPAFAFRFQSGELEVSLQQEIMRVMFRSNVDRAIEIAVERLKANPADPVVLSSLNLVAAIPSVQGMLMLTGIVKNPPNARARRDAIFWLGQSRGDKDASVDTLLSILPTLSDDDSEALVYSLSQIRTDKAVNALATIAGDKSRAESVRKNAVRWIGQSLMPNRFVLLESIYKNNMDNSRIRQQAIYALSQTHEPEAMSIVGTVAASDPDIEIRRQAAFWLGQAAFLQRK